MPNADLDCVYTSLLHTWALKGESHSSQASRAETCYLHCDKTLSSRGVTAGDPDEHPAGRATTAQPSLPQSLARLGACPELSNCQIKIRRLQGKQLYRKEMGILMLTVQSLLR